MLLKYLARGLFRDKFASCPRRLHTSVANEFVSKTDEQTSRDEEWQHGKRKRNARTCPFHTSPNLIEKLGILCACSAIILGSNFHPHNAPANGRRRCSYKVDWTTLNSFITRCLNPIPGVLPKAVCFPPLQKVTAAATQTSVDDGYASVSESKSDDSDDQKAADKRLSQLYSDIVRESDQYSATFCNVFGVSLVKSGNVLDGMKWLKRSGNQESLFNLGLVYEKGLHNAACKPDVNLALDCYSRAAEMGHRSAANNLLALLKQEITMQRKKQSQMDKNTTATKLQSDSPKLPRSQTEIDLVELDERPRFIAMYGMELPVATLAMPSIS